jgi:hypothetical protein
MKMTVESIDLDEATLDGTRRAIAETLEGRDVQFLQVIPLRLRTTADEPGSFNKSYTYFEEGIILVIGEKDK